MAFSDKIWWTRKARIQTEKRLLANAFQSQVLLLWYSFYSVAVSIYYLSEDKGSDGTAGVSWVVFSVLVLCISGFINGLSFKERAALIKECYETLNGLYHRAKKDNADIDILAKEYEQVLSVCENHTSDDFFMALCEAYLTHPDPKGAKESPKSSPEPLDQFPTWYHWIFVAWSITKRWSMLAALYSLPLVITFALEMLV